ncbi:unnamed protein product, partial [Rotaria sordida]
GGIGFVDSDFLFGGVIGLVDGDFILGDVIGLVNGGFILSGIIGNELDSLSFIWSYYSISHSCHTK